MEKYFSANPSFTRLDSDLTEDVIPKVSNLLKNYGSIKTHKPGRKLCVTTVGTNSGVAQLSAFTERFLGPIAHSLGYILVDITNFLRLLQEINGRFCPMPDHFLSV